MSVLQDFHNLMVGKKRKICKVNGILFVLPFPLSHFDKLNFIFYVF